jgi:hypothetical protein
MILSSILTFVTKQKRYLVQRPCSSVCVTWCQQLRMSVGFSQSSVYGDALQEVVERA